MTSRKLPLRFQSVAHSWVALHPKPKGVIQFIGGAFFGTFGPTLFYRHLLQYLFDQSYTLVLLPFNFTFNHYKEAGLLAKEQYQILPDLVRAALLENYDYKIYLSERNYTWMGHSLGCKYVALLEGLSALPEDESARVQFIREVLVCAASADDRKPDEKEIQRTVSQINTLVEELEKEAVDAKKLVCQYIKEYGRGHCVNVSSTRFTSADSTSSDLIDFSSLFIKNQPSILLAPDISGTSSAIRPEFLAQIIDQLGWGVKPTPVVTHELIKKSKLFNLLGLVCFQNDDIAKETCQWFLQDLKKPSADYQETLLGGHLRPLGTRVGNRVFTFFLDWPWVTPLDQRNAEFEALVAKLLNRLRSYLSRF
ncbi:MAG: DUF1350 family protein [Cyanobacteria bacterium J06621_11]